VSSGPVGSTIPGTDSLSGGPSAVSTDAVRLGVVIPTLNEEDHLPLILDDLARLPLPHRVLVADGGSRDGSLEAARQGGAWVVEAPRGRARQMNAGAALLETPWLLFLHADSRIPEPTAHALATWLADPPPAEAAHFAFRLDGNGWSWRFLEAGQRIREALSGLAYGDQGLLVSRQRFAAVGGFPDIPLMEDVEMVRRLRRGPGLDRIPAPLPTSTRRYRSEGWVRAWLRNASLLLLHHLGASPETLASRYPARAPEARGSGEAGNARALLVFAKSPRPGHVKTRLAGEVGAGRATEIYRRMGREAVDRLRGGPWRTVICFDPPQELPTVRDWLGPEGLSFQPQSDGDLGERLTGAFRQAFRTGGPVCVVGTDIPELGQPLVENAFRLLETEGGPDVVLGPAVDGGYYLLGARVPSVALFQGIPWSTRKVREHTLARAREEGLRVEELPVLADVDRAEDLPPAYHREHLPLR
jgi:rSAM/selenodomain-associated transferase 2/rSAM/selenodomain-associated transferase 1